MKKIAFLLVLLNVTIACNSDEDTVSLEKNYLTLEENNDLKFSREEEKLARDVYFFSYDKYGLVVFNNIAKSEQQHMNQILTLLNYYDIEDPASTEIGIFSNEELQKLYNDLISISSQSLLEALKVGALIEDLDINDLNDLESRTTKTDILSVYDKLECGSRNHMRNFISQLDLQNVTYVPQYISIEDFDAIMASPNEKCGQ